jgi:hypothetical protein
MSGVSKLIIFGKKKNFNVALKGVFCICHKSQESGFVDKNFYL